MAHVLVIDDDPLIRQMARRILEGSGHLVIEAENGAIGLEQLEENSVALVLTDIVMPNKEGIETIQDIRRSHPDVKVIAMSGSGAHQLYLDTATKLGAHATLNKPFRPDDLREIVGRVLGR
jgi:DNA-binding NtrC family response regulator